MSGRSGCTARSCPFLTRAPAGPAQGIAAAQPSKPSPIPSLSGAGSSIHHDRRPILACRRAVHRGLPPPPLPPPPPPSLASARTRLPHPSAPPPPPAARRPPPPPHPPPPPPGGGGGGGGGENGPTHPPGATGSVLSAPSP